MLLHASIQIIANHHAWLYAATFPLTKGKTALEVYRSTALHKYDDWYKPVEKYIFLNRAELISKEIVEDESMMFGEAEHTTWTIEEST